MSHSSPSLSVLVSHGCTLAALQRKGMNWKNKSATSLGTGKQEQRVDPRRVVDDIGPILGEFQNTGHPESSSLEEKGMTKVLRKIEGILRQLIRDDNENEKHYGKLVKDIEEYLSDLTRSQKRSTSSLVAAASLELDDSFFNQVSQRESEEIDFRSVYKNFLTDNEQRCFSFCHTFFSAFVNPVTINKRELIYWWIGMDLIDDASQGKQLLSKLVAEELLLSSNKSSWYTMPFMTLEAHRYTAAQKDRLFVAYNNIAHRVESPATGADKIVAAINTNAYTLNAKIFDWLFQMKSAKLVHLGSWHRGMDYVVIEDMIIKSLNSLKSLKEVRFLSFQGISRLQELPYSVYNLVNLKVLDLRACQDLRILPKGIESLQHLIHLDLSQCYELHYIPRGISALSKLRVLKGFVINGVDSNRRIVVRKQKSSSCPFNQLSKLQELTKLTIRTKMINFPRKEDVETLCMMQELTKLKITWVRTTSSSNVELEAQNDDYLQRFPPTVHKLELQAAPESTALRLLSLISNRSQNKLEKLYIRGGGPWKLEPQKYGFPNVKVVRFRYLPRLHMNWFEFKLAFPNITRFEMFACPHLIFFPTDEDGVWEKS